MILIISYPDEDHTTDVVGRLRNAGWEVGILNLGDFPSRSGIEMSWQPTDPQVYIIDGPNGTLDLSSVRVTWWRRVVPFDIEPKIGKPVERAFAESETAQAMNGLLDSLDCIWVNPRFADEAAHRKPFQWEIAKRVGLTLPRTLVTNKPEIARSFIKQIGVNRTVFKAFLATTDAWRETRLVEQEDMERLDSVRYAPVIFQEYIEGVDLRITVVGEQLFTGEIDARKTSYPVDMRMVISEAKIQPIKLPRNVHDSIIRFMKAIGLVYGAIDMRRTEQGDYVFLEVNPAGQWLFVEQRTELNISQAMADLLIAFHNNPIQSIKL